MYSESDRELLKIMESGKVLPLLCLILVCVLDLSSGQCPRNEEVVDCKNDCNTCELRGFCYDCTSEACDCIRGYARNFEGVCIPTSRCPSMDGDDGEVLVAEEASPRCIPYTCSILCSLKKKRGRCKNRRCDCF